MPQDDKKLAQKKLDALRNSSKDKVKESEYAAARKKTEVNYSGLSKTKSAPASDTNNSAGAVQRSRGLSSAALEHIQSAEQERMRKRDTPLSATPNLDLESQLARPRNK